VHGDPDTVGEKLAAFVATGLDGITVSLPASGHVPGRVSLLGEVAGRALG
jgi:alkanesulfonate monooxygenase SsuD/methylene tetrahydromethanopterin reductase-like flavin-dependent oxidoreductase (luciferase family)